MNITPTIRPGFTFASTKGTMVIATTAPIAGPKRSKPRIPAERCKWALIAGIRAAHVPETKPTRKNTMVTAIRWALGERSKGDDNRSRGAEGAGRLRKPGSNSDTMDRQSCGLQLLRLFGEGVRYQLLDRLKTAHSPECHRLQL